MLSEQRYREVMGEVMAIASRDNNDFILALAINGLILLPMVGNPRPFPHYNQAPDAVFEISKKGQVIQAWPDSWIVDGDWQDHVKSEVARFNFTPLKK